MKVLSIAIILAFIAVPLFAMEADTYSYFTKEEIAAIVKDTVGEKPKPFRCPVSKISNQDKCFGCHTKPSFKLKEAPPDETLTVPYNTTLVKDVAQYRMHGPIDQGKIMELGDVLRYIAWHPEIKVLEVEILSGGGSLFIAWELIALLEAAKYTHMIRTVVPGFAASAAFLIFAAGDERIVYKHAILMTHELWTFEMFKMEDVSDSEEAARVKRLFQNNIHEYLASKSTLTKEQLDEYVRGEKDYWMTGAEAKGVGFATEFLSASP